MLYLFIYLSICSKLTARESTAAYMISIQPLKVALSGKIHVLGV